MDDAAPAPADNNVTTVTADAQQTPPTTPVAPPTRSLLTPLVGGSKFTLAKHTAGQKQVKVAVGKSNHHKRMK